MTHVWVLLSQEQNIVVDYSSPNLAKEMHVGHLRTTIIDDAVVKCLSSWATTLFVKITRATGSLVRHVACAPFRRATNEVAETALSDLEDFYREAKVRFDEEGFADRAREYVVKLQSGDAQCLALWEKFIDVSIAHSEEVYDKLNVSLTRKDIMGESAENDDLNVISDQTKGLAVEDQGAQVVFIPELADKEGNPAVYIVQKSGGGYTQRQTFQQCAIAAAS